VRLYVICTMVNIGEGAEVKGLTKARMAARIGINEVTEMIVDLNIL